MPIIKSAKKKLRQDVKKTKKNLVYENAYKKAIQTLKKKAQTGKEKKKIGELVNKAYSAIDKAVKKKIVHKNKGARLKSMVAKYLSS